MAIPPRWLSVREVARHLDLPMQAVISLAATGALTAKRVHDHWEIDPDAVRAYRARTSAVFMTEEDAASAGLAAEHPDPEALPRHIPWREGPPIGDDAEDEYRREQET